MLRDFPLFRVETSKLPVKDLNYDQGHVAASNWRGVRGSCMSDEYHVDHTISEWGLASDLGAYKAPQLPHLVELQTASIQSFTPNTCITYAQFRTSIQPTDSATPIRRGTSRHTVEPAFGNQKIRLGMFSIAEQRSSTPMRSNWRSSLDRGNKSSGTSICQDLSVRLSSYIGMSIYILHNWPSYALLVLLKSIDELRLSFCNHF
jgi:hypothetical protein